MDSYVLRRGRSGALRLEVLGRAAAPATLALLDRLPWQPHWRSLDVGCGIGLVTSELARRGESALGVDNGSEFASSERVRFRWGDARQLDDLKETFEVVYARYLLSHLADPQEVVAGMARRLAPGGYLVLEDVDFPGHTCDPPCPAFEAYLQLYQELVRRRGGDAGVGRRLWRLASQAGLEVVYSGVSLALFREGWEKRVAELTLAHIARGLVQQGLAERARLAEWLRQLRAHRRGPSQISLAPTYQVVAKGCWPGPA